MEKVHIIRVIMAKMIEYVKIFDDNKSMSFHINDDKLLEKYKNIGSKIEELKGDWLTILPVHDDRYIKTKTKTYNKKINTDFCN